MWSQFCAWLGAIFAVISAIFWVRSTIVSKPASEGSAGWGALLGGEVVVPGPKGERLDLAGTLLLQSKWNKYAALATAVTAVLTALGLVFQTKGW